MTTIDNQSVVESSFVLPDETTTTLDAESNTATTEVLTYAITKVKSSSVDYLTAGATALQTVTITNDSSVDMTNVEFTDTLSSGASYVSGSVIVDGTAESTYDPSTGFSLSDIAAGDTVIVEYEIEADNPLTSDTITNYATISYDVDDNGTIESFEEDTNTVELTAVSTSITVTKSVDKSYALAGDTLTYTIVITNDGTIEATDITFTDTLPTGSTFTTGTVTIDGTSYADYDPTTGFSLDDLAALASTTIVFEAEVD
ncbi:MAG: hypothetical protein R3Y23_03090 [Bacillota bacterium]